MIQSLKLPWAGKGREKVRLRQKYSFTLSLPSLTPNHRDDRALTSVGDVLT